MHQLSYSANLREEFLSLSIVKSFDIVLCHFLGSVSISPFQFACRPNTSTILATTIVSLQQAYADGIALVPLTDELIIFLCKIGNLLVSFYNFN